MFINRDVSLCQKVGTFLRPYLGKCIESLGVVPEGILVLAVFLPGVVAARHNKVR